MPYILKLWLINVPEFAVIFCQLLLIRNLIEQLFLTLSSSISAHGEIKAFQIISSFVCFFPLVVSYFLFKMGYPAYAIYVVFIIYSLLASAVILYFALNNFKFPVSYFMKNTVLRCLFSFFVIMGVSFIPNLILKEGFLRLSLVVIISTIFFPIAIWFIGFRMDERIQIKPVLMHLIGKFLPR